jgi:hypothetical protein
MSTLAWATLHCAGPKVPEIIQLSLVNTGEPGEVKEIQKAEKTNMRVLKVSKKVTKKPSVKLLGGLIIRDGKCIKAGVYNPKPQPMENCKPAAKTKVACDAGANCADKTKCETHYH